LEAAPTATSGLIHLLHFLAATFRRRHLRRGLFDGVALITDVILLLGAGIIGFFAFMLTTTAAHKPSPLLLDLGGYPPEHLPSGPAPGRLLLIIIIHQY
jgi:hypothetical protein